MAAASGVDDVVVLLPVLFVEEKDEEASNRILDLLSDV